MTQTEVPTVSSMFGQEFALRMQTKNSVLLDLEDIRRDALPFLPKDHIQPQFKITDPASPLPPCSICSYSERLNGEPTSEPSCIVGHIIKLLAPSYFGLIKGSLYSVNELPNIDTLFTRRAIDFMQRAQGYADGYGETDQQPWGDAITNTLFDLVP